MNKEKIKNFWEDHKYDIAAAGCFIVSGVLLAYGIRGIKKFNDEGLELIKDFELAIGGGKQYVPGTGEEVVKLIGKDTVTCGGGKTLKVTGAMFFGDIVETQG